jgi:hypothetical protein
MKIPISEPDTLDQSSSSEANEEIDFQPKINNENSGKRYIGYNKNDQTQ